MSSRTFSGVAVSARGQLELMSGRRTVFSGLSIFADSAMNFTPQKTMTSDVVFEAIFASSSESPR